MNCPLHTEETSAILLDYSAGRLDAAGTTALEGHMEGCADCAAFRREQGNVWDALDTWQNEPVSVDFNRRFWARIEAEKALPWYRKLLWKPALPLVFAALLMTFGFLMDHRGAPARPVVTISEADQVEQELDDIQLLYLLDSNTDNGSGRKM